MNVATILYLLVIRPLELFFEVIFSFANRIVSHPGLAIIALSLSMNILVLPLYKRADAMQEEERLISERLKKGIAHIKKTFKGDERFMMLQTYYRQNNYKPSYALRGSLSLLLQVPFFIAAYRFLSGLALLRGVSFGPIADLGAPDALIHVGNVSINVLPILMTLINMVSGAIYTKGHPIKTKIQLYGVAFVFLILLYKSPAGLVFYWTLNNLFSLIKNIFYKLKNAKKILTILLSVTGFVMLGASIFTGMITSKIRLLFVLCLFVILEAPAVRGLLLKNKKSAEEKKLPRQPSKLFFYAGAAFVAVLIGVLIPSSVIKASPAEFVNIYNAETPNLILAYSGFVAAGFFLVWCGIFYSLADCRVKLLFENIIWIVAGVTILDFMAFGKNLGNISTMLQFDDGLMFSKKEKLINILLILAVASVLYAIVRLKPAIARGVVMTGLLSVAVLSIVNVADVEKYYRGLVISDSVKEDARLPLSRDGQNVVVIMLDRAIGGYVPYLMNERPDLRAKFDGFTYYPDTTSFGRFTNFGTPPIYGGYDYTPSEMNKRDTELIADKHTESLKVMPTIFRDAGYEVTMCDPTYAGYQYVPDLSVFDGEGFNTYITIGKYNDSSNEVVIQDTRRRNIFFYGVMKAAPLVFQGVIYNNGLYNKADSVDAASEEVAVQTQENRSVASGISDLFMDNYSTLCKLNELTEVRDGQNSFILLVNETTHDPAILSEPDYVPAMNIDNTDYDLQHEDRFTVDGKTMICETAEQMEHYQTNMAAYIKLGEWFDYLRECGVYDNTRIILVSDHGRGLNQFEDIDFTEEGLFDMERYNCLLMVKDFNATGFTVSDEWMTNADTPTLATEGIIDDPVNPFTGNRISSDYKESGIEVIDSLDYYIDLNNGYKFLPGDWYSLKGSMFKKENWSYLGEY